MLRIISLDIPRAILLVLVQVVVLNQLDLFDGTVAPFLYLMVLLLLPLEMPVWITMLIGLACGLVIDIFTFTPGMHASACVTLCYARPFFLKVLRPRDGYEFGMKPQPLYLGWRWFFLYCGALTLLHLLVLFVLEVLRLDLLPSAFFRAIFSAVATVLLIMLVVLLFFKRSLK